MRIRLQVCHHCAPSDTLRLLLRGRERGKRRDDCLSLTIARAVSCFFPGMQAASFDNTSADHLDTIQRARSAVAQERFTLEERVALRADLGQSQSGSSSLSPRAYRAQSTTAELAVSEIGPITSVRAPRYFAGRSRKGAKATLEKGGRTDRWPQMTAIPSRTILQSVKLMIYKCHIKSYKELRTAPTSLLG